ncbi:UNC-like C-terminal-domain-containing protein [Scleroderma yunnanense]
MLPLPRSLLALTLLAVAFPLAVSSASVSTNDPFRSIVVRHRALHPGPPLCCLKPLPSADPPEGPEDTLLSFEEWKSKQSRAHSQTTAPRTETSTEGDPRQTDTAATPLTDHANTPPGSYPQDSISPHFRVPLTDRFNYANMDCSARVHMSHRSAKSASSILSEKKDRYMLSPCSAAQKDGQAQFVVVELCDDIRIDTVQLANFEFFSGVFKDFTVRVAKTYPATDDGWTLAGTYRAKNVRGVQSFHPPTSLRDFYRYIRIDFHSHYGHEYYCPVSLLRIYGLTHLEQWKWDMWEAESRARLQEQRPLIAEGTATVQESTPSVSTFIDILESGSIIMSATINGKGISEQQGTAVPQTNSSSTTKVSGMSPSPSTPSISGAAPEPTPFADVALPTMSSSLGEVISSIASMMSHEAPFTTIHTQPTNEQPYTRATEFQSSPSPSSLAAHGPSISTAPQAHTHSSVVYTTAHSPIPSGESIFGTIMNRLTVLEANHTLYARYVEEQTTGVREVLRKLGEEVGRLESIGQMQAQMYQRTVLEWERQRLRLELEHSELLARVNHLADEVVLEKRLGIAQLCLLLTVLVFMGLTRGAPAVEHSRTGLTAPMREWGARSLSFGSSKEGGWNPLRLRSRSPVVQRSVAIGSDTPTILPSSIVQRRSSLVSFSPRHTPKASKSASSSTSSLQKHLLGSPSSRTPTRNRPLVTIDPSSLPRVLPLAKSNSSSGSTHTTSRSAKRLARTAHLHEVKLSHHRRGLGSSGHTDRRTTDQENIYDGDVFAVAHTALPLSATSLSLSLQDDARDPFSSRKSRRPFSPLSAARMCTGEENKDGDAWVDTDGSEADTAPYDSM